MQMIGVLLCLLLFSTTKAQAQKAGTDATAHPCNESCVVAYNQNGDITGYACNTGGSGVMGYGCGASRYGCALWTDGCSGNAVLDGNGQFQEFVMTCPPAAKTGLSLSVFHLLGEGVVMTLPDPRFQVAGGMV